VCALTEDKEGDIKYKFYEELQTVQNGGTNHDVTIILGDMNAKLRKDKLFSQAVGHHTLHNVCNENGELVAYYAISCDMFLVSTKFQHKTIHTGTWMSPNHQTINQTDHFMASKGTMRLVHDVKSKRV
jgi:hypothetical protein